MLDQASGNDRLARNGETAGHAAPDAASLADTLPSLAGERQLLYSRAQQLLKAIPLSQPFAAGPGAAPIALDLPSLLRVLRNSTEVCDAIVSFIDSLNEVGRPTAGRTTEASAELLPVAAGHINQRLKTRELQVTAAEKRLLRTFAKSHGGQLKWPSWYVPAKAIIDLVGTSGEFPGPEVYLARSRRMSDSSQALREEYILAKIEFGEKERSKKPDEGPGGKETTKAMLKLEKLGDKLDRLLDEAGDVDPACVRECCENVRVAAVLKTEVTKTMLAVLESMGRAIELMVLGGATTDKAGPSSLTSMQVTTLSQPGSRVIKEVKSIVLDASLLLDKEHKAESLAVVLSEYTKLQKTLIRVYQQYQEQYRGRDIARLAIARDLEDGLSVVFVRDAERARDIFLRLAEHKNESVQESLATLLSGQVLEGGLGRGINCASFLDKKENVQLLGVVLSRLIYADDLTAKAMMATMSSGPLSQLTDLAKKVRPYAHGKDLATLAQLFDDELTAAVESKYTFFSRKALVLHALMLMADDERLRPALKGRLKHFKLIDQLATSLTAEVRGQNTPQARFVEKARARITRRFSSDLSDYWGQRELVKDWKSLLDKHLKLLSRPDMWLGIPPSRLFYNGYLLFGVPGAGKTFLVTCMANELEIPLIVISREELAQTFKNAEKDEETEVGKIFAKFLETKIKDLETAKRKTGARAAILFIDEMEAEFLRRDPRTCSRGDLTRTNIMLRMIEECISENPEVIFVGATNHIQFVDEAALRKGRFGIPLEVKMPKREDILEILSGTFASLGVTVPPDIAAGAGYEKLVETCTGMIPLAMQLAINNAVVLQRIEQDRYSVQLDEGLLKLLVESAEMVKKLEYEELKRFQAEPSGGGQEA